MPDSIILSVSVPCFLRIHFFTDLEDLFAVDETGSNSFVCAESFRLSSRQKKFNKVFEKSGSKKQGLMMFLFVVFVSEVLSGVG